MSVITRKIDELGRIVLPKELRKTLGIEPGTPIEIYTEDDMIVLKKFENRCVLLTFLLIGVYRLTRYFFQKKIQNIHD